MCLCGVIQYHELLHHNYTVLQRQSFFSYYIVCRVNYHINWVNCHSFSSLCTYNHSTLKQYLIKDDTVNQ